MARLHLRELMGCNWTAKEGSLAGPMIVFAKEKCRMVHDRNKSW